MFYNFPGAPGNTGYQAQANPNPLADPRNRIPGVSPNSIPMLPGEDPGAIRGVYGAPNQGQPFMNTQPRLPLAQGFGDIGNMAGMEIAGARKNFNLLNPLSWFGGDIEESLKHGASPSTPAGKMINRMKNDRDKYDELRRQGIL